MTDEELSHVSKRYIYERLEHYKMLATKFQKENSELQDKLNHKIELLEQKLQIAREALQEIADTDAPWCIGPRIALAKMAAMDGEK